MQGPPIRVSASFLPPQVAKSAHTLHRCATNSENLLFSLKDFVGCVSARLGDPAPNTGSLLSVAPEGREFTLEATWRTLVPRFQGLISDMDRVTGMPAHEVVDQHNEKPRVRAIINGMDVHVRAALNTPIASDNLTFFGRQCTIIRRIVQQTHWSSSARGDSATTSTSIGGAHCLACWENANSSACHRWIVRAREEDLRCLSSMWFIRGGTEGAHQLQLN